MTSVLSKEVLKEIKKIKKADILVGIPSLNNEKTISYVTKTVKEGLNKYFPEYRCVIVNSDCGSKDKTREAFKKQFNKNDRIYSISSIFRGKPGKGKAFRRIFEITNLLKAKTCVVVDSDLRSIKPEWIKILARPILDKGFDYVAPFYNRHQHSGTITNFIAYPLTQTLYGKKIRQPIGGEFAFSKKMLKKYLSFKNIWRTDVAFFGIDIWMTTLALINSPKVCQVYLGIKVHDPKDPARDLAPMFKQVIGTIFSLAYENQKIWLGIKGSKEIKAFKKSFKVFLEKEVKVNLPNLVKKFKQGFKNYERIYREKLEEENFKTLESLSKTSFKDFGFPSKTWIKILYDYLVFYKGLRENKQNKKIELILESLIPIYFGFIGSFIKMTKHDSFKVAEGKIQKIAQEFENLKPYLVKKWNKQQATSDKKF